MKGGPVLPLAACIFVLFALPSAVGQEPPELRPSTAQSLDEIYEVGTNVGMEYLSENSGRLRVTLILQECKFDELATAVGKLLPNTVEYFIMRRTTLGWPQPMKMLAAQVARSYVLGFEAGVRTEFAREASPDVKRRNCSIAAAAAGQLMQE